MSDTRETIEDPSIAREFRDLVDTRIVHVLERERPSYRYATVDSISPDTGQVWVLYPGSTEPVPVKYGAVRPTQIGQVVRIDGKPGDRYVVDVVGVSALSDTVPADLPDITGLAVAAGPLEVYIDWDNNAAPRYEVNMAEDAAFTTNNRAFIVSQSEYTAHSVEQGVTYYVRVRSLNNTDGAGNWSETFSAVVTDYPDPPLDGSPPDASPQPNVTAGIGMISATWAAATGTTDRVTYEVHVALSSGFVPTAATLLEQTTTQHMTTAVMPDGTSLSTLYGQNVFVRLIAKDGDGAAPVSAQGFAAPLQVELGDVGNVGLDDLSDGLAPASSPTPVAEGGFGYIYVKWDHVANDDPVTYEVHMSSLASFTPNANTLSGTTPSNWFFVRKLSTQAQGTIGGTNSAAVGTNDAGYNTGHDLLPPGVPFYIKVVATDPDGTAPTGGETVSQSLRIDTDAIEYAAIHEALIADAAITRAKILDLAVDSAKISNAAITNAKIAYAAIGSANIQDAAINTAHITDASITTAKIGTAQVTNANIDTLSAAKITAGSIGAHTITLAGATSILQSSNFPTSGWQLKGDGTLTAKSGTFSGDLIAADGTFTGELVAAQGTFAGQLSAAGGTFTGELSAAGGTFTGSLSGADGTFSGGLSAATGTFTGELVAAQGTFVGTVSAGAVTASTISGGTISATTMSGSTLTASTITATNISGGTVTGTTVRTAAPYATRVELTTGNQIYFFYSGWNGGTFPTMYMDGFSDGGNPILVASNGRNLGIKVDSGSNGGSVIIHNQNTNAQSRIQIINASGAATEFQQSSVGLVFQVGTAQSIVYSRGNVGFGGPTGYAYMALQCVERGGTVSNAGISGHYPDLQLASCWRVRNGDLDTGWISLDWSGTQLTPVVALNLSYSSTPDTKTDMALVKDSTLEKIMQVDLIEYRRLHDADPTRNIALEDTHAERERRFVNATEQQWAALDEQMNGRKFLYFGVDVSQKICELLPEVVTWGSAPDGGVQAQGIELGSATFAAWKAIQELKHEIDDLRADALRASGG